jgi:AcrR family transcriptional regulator
MGQAGNPNGSLISSGWVMAKLKKLEKLKDKTASRLINRVETRNDLAAHAIKTLSQLGYARTGMRDIAQQSDRSVGALTYYFDDKVDLICYCVRVYKEGFIAEIDLAIDQGRIQGDVIRSVAKAFAQAVAQDAETHRLWYDIRSQSLFESSFREIVKDIEENLISLISRILENEGMSRSELRTYYFILDGLFRMALQEQLDGQTKPAAELEREIVAVLSGAQLRAPMPLRTASHSSPIET